MALSDEIHDILAEFGNKTVNDLRSSLDLKDITNSRLSASIKFTVTQQSKSIVFSLTLADYYKWVNDGRQNGKMPPIAPIEQWIKRKGLLKSNKPEKGTKKKKSKRSFDDRVKSMAFGVAKNIAKKGTIKRFNYKGSKFYDEVLNDGRLENLQKEISDVFKKDIIIEITNDSNK